MPKDKSGGGALKGKQNTCLGSSTAKSNFKPPQTLTLLKANASPEAT